jgi:hypothetical protein
MGKTPRGDTLLTQPCAAEKWLVASGLIDNRIVIERLYRD